MGETKGQWDRLIVGISRPLVWKDRRLLYVVPVCCGVDGLVGVVSRQARTKTQVQGQE